MHNAYDSTYNDERLSVYFKRTFIELQPIFVNVLKMHGIQLVLLVYVHGITDKAKNPRFLETYLFERT